MEPQHMNGNSNVAKFMKNQKNKKKPLVGVVDSDKFKKTPPYFNSFTVTLDKKDNLILKQQPNTKQYIIFVCPKFEPWIWNCAVLANVDPTKGGYINLNALYKATKRAELDSKFKNFLNSVVQKNPSPIKTMRNWLNKIIEN
ncbi:MAG: hypothetical protein IIA88_04220 [Bacteroidetes bacterium]|nr:hypothetical protein [Bacteroidota bacterium]